MMTKSDDCIVPGCTNPQHTRGLCEKCYSNANRMVRAGDTNWAELIDMGLALASKRTKDENLTFRKAFEAAKRDRSYKAFGPSIGLTLPDTTD